MFSNIFKYITIGAMAAFLSIAGASAKNNVVVSVLAYCPTAEDVIEYLKLPVGLDEVYFDQHCTALLLPVPGFDPEYEKISLDVEWYDGVMRTHIWSFKLSTDPDSPRVYLFLRSDNHAILYRDIYGTKI